MFGKNKISTDLSNESRPLSHRKNYGLMSHHCATHSIIANDLQ